MVTGISLILTMQEITEVLVIIMFHYSFHGSVHSIGWGGAASAERHGHRQQHAQHMKMHAALPGANLN